MVQSWGSTYILYKALLVCRVRSRGTAAQPTLSSRSTLFLKTNPWLISSFQTIFQFISSTEVIMVISEVSISIWNSFCDFLLPELALKASKQGNCPGLKVQGRAHWANRQYLKLNCVSIPWALLESNTISLCCFHSYLVCPMLQSGLPWQCSFLPIVKYFGSLQPCKSWVQFPAEHSAVWVCLSSHMLGPVLKCWALRTSFAVRRCFMFPETTSPANIALLVPFSQHWSQTHCLPKHSSTLSRCPLKAAGPHRLTLALWSHLCQGHCGVVHMGSHCLPHISASSI